LSSAGAVLATAAAGVLILRLALEEPAVLGVWVMMILFLTVRRSVILRTIRR